MEDRDCARSTTCSIFTIMPMKAPLHRIYFIFVSIIVPLLTAWDISIGFFVVRLEDDELTAQVALGIEPPPKNKSERTPSFLNNNWAESNATTEKSKNRVSDSIYCDSLRLQEKRIHNSQDGISLDVASSMIEPNLLNQAHLVLGKTICHEQGRFRDTSTTAMWNVSNEELLNEWEFKLIYLAIHSFHHQPALLEYNGRKQCKSIESLPPYEYDCKDTKYIVTDLPNKGLGAAFRLSAVAHVLMGIASNRIPLFVSNSPEGPSFLQNKTTLASCPRGDFQCVFLPTTPCSLKIEDLVNGTILEESDARSLRRSGVLAPKIENEAVLIVKSRQTPAIFDKFEDAHRLTRKRIYDRAIVIINEWKASLPHVDYPKLRILTTAAKRILSPDTPKLEHQHYEYGHRYAHLAVS